MLNVRLIQRPFVSEKRTFLFSRFAIFSSSLSLMILWLLLWADSKPHEVRKYVSVKFTLEMKKKSRKKMKGLNVCLRLRVLLFVFNCFDSLFWLVFCAFFFVYVFSLSNRFHPLVFAHFLVIVFSLHFCTFLFLFENVFVCLNVLHAMVDISFVIASFVVVFSHFFVQKTFTHEFFRIFSLYFSAVATQFFFLAAFFWLNTMCFNIWWTFRWVLVWNERKHAFDKTFIRIFTMIRLQKIK